MAIESYRNVTELPNPNGVFAGLLQDSGRMVVSQGPGLPYFDVAGGKQTSVTATYTILPSDSLVLAGNTTSYTTTLPLAADVPAGWTIRIKKTGASGTLTIGRAGSDTIDGATSIATSTQYDTIMLTSNGVSAWLRTNLAGTAAQRLLTVTTQTTTATVASTDDLTVDTGTADHTLTLPAVSGLTGIVLRFKKTGVSGVVTVDGAASETIDGALTFTMTEQYESATIVCTGAAWVRLDNTPVLTQQDVTTTATVLPNTDIVNITAEAGAYAITLPTPAARGAGKTLIIKKNVGTGANAQTLTRVGAETIDGATSLAVTAARRIVVLYSDGTNWLVLNNHTPAAG